MKKILKKSVSHITDIAQFTVVSLCATLISISAMSFMVFIVG